MLLNPHPGKSFFCVIVVSFLMVSGCSNISKQHKANATLKNNNDESVCQQLQDLFDKSIDGFRSIREQPNYLNKATLWKSRYQLIADSCEIWQWSDKYSYVCSRVMPDKDSADVVYQQVLESIDKCMNSTTSQWQKQQISLDHKGQETRYNLNSKQRGSLKVVDTGGVFQDSWTVYFRVDSPDMIR